MSQKNQLPEHAVSEWINGKAFPDGKPLILGLSAPQGAGKTTLAKQLKDDFGEKLAVLSMDDFYLPLAAREGLAEEVSPLFATRGAPGTHDLEFLNDVIDRLLDAEADTETRLPRFDKSIDDRVEEHEWLVHKGRPDIILLEGWCVGALISPNFVSSMPLNDAEMKDIDNAWREYSAQQLQGPYLSLWKRCDDIFYMLPKDFSVIIDWRSEQEETNLGIKKGTLSEERRDWVRSFIQYFQRITEGILRGHRCEGEVIYIDEDRMIVNN